MKLQIMKNFILENDASSEDVFLGDETETEIC